MAFGQPSGLPASAKQVQELLTLLHDAGHTDFRDARGPLGLTQRQAAGKFTRDEATDYIDRLQDAGADPQGGAPALRGHEAPALRRRQPAQPARAGPPPAAGAAPAAASGVVEAVRRSPTEHLVDELRRRGWTVSAPTPAPPANPRAS